MKKVVIYDKWLSTLGGGEVVACSFVNALEDEYEVTLVSDTPVDQQLVYDKLGFDISRAKLKVIWFDENKLVELSQNAEIFINVSFMDYSYGRAKRNFYYAYFPSGNLGSIKSAVKDRLILPLLAKTLPYYPFYINATPLVKHNRKAYLLGKKKIEFRYSSLESQTTYELTFPFYLESMSFSELREIKIQLRGGKEKQRKVWVDHHTNVVKIKIDFQPDGNALSGVVTLPKQPNEIFSEKCENYLLCPKLHRKHTLFSLPHRVVAKLQERFRAGVYADLSERLSSYQTFFAVSRFTKNWVYRFWGKKSVVLYPPVKLFPNTKGKKRKQIVNVGRFFTLGHGKKQEIMVEAFRQFFTQGNTDWELHLIGGVDKDDLQTMEYIQKLEGLAQGLPVFFHFNVSRSELESIVRQSKIYWHATGYGESLPVKREHFGISVIEAMSAQCLPLVFNGGGLPEIVQATHREKQRHVFETIPELVRKTEYWVKNYDLYVPPSRELLEDLFSQERFNRECLKYINML